MTTPNPSDTPHEVVLRVGDDISTDVIYPGRYMATVLPSETPKHAFADNTAFNERLRRGDIPPGSVVVGGSNFGCGSSREQAASALKGSHLIVIAGSFARIFLQNAVNLGLEAITCPGIEAAEGDRLEISHDRVCNTTTGRMYAILPLAPARQAIMSAGGLIQYTRKRLKER